MTLNPSLGQLFVDSNVEIQGPGADQITVDAQTASRVFSIGAAADVTISGLTITGGSADVGGGVRNAGTLTLSNVAIIGNQATEDGGGVYSSTGTQLYISGNRFESNVAGERGGGLYSGGTDETVCGDSYFGGNTAGSYGGGVWAANTDNATFSSCKFEGNQSGSRGAGAAVVDAVVSFTNCQFTENHSEAMGGGLYNSNGSHTQVTNCRFEGNQANSSGGAISNLSENTEINIELSVITNNEALGSGGGIAAWSLTNTRLTGTTVSGNSSLNGGGIQLQEGATADITNQLNLRKHSDADGRWNTQRRNGLAV